MGTLKLSVRLDLCKRGRRGSNPQPPDRQSGTTGLNRPKNVVSEEERTISAPNRSEVPPDLAEVAAAWSNLPAAVRAGIVAMVKATRS